MENPFQNSIDKRPEPPTKEEVCVERMSAMVSSAFLKKAPQILHSGAKTEQMMMRNSLHFWFAILAVPISHPA